MEEKMKRFVSILIVTMTTALSAPAAWAVACGDTIGPNAGLVTLAGSLSCSTATALFVVGPKTVLDLKGQQITCDGTVPTAVGIDISGTGAVVRNGVVTGCQTGVLIESGASKNKVLNVVSQSNTGDGFIVAGDSNVLLNNSAINNGGDGTALGDDGFEVDGNTNTLEFNTATGNSTEGFLATGTSNKLVQNDADHSGYDGFGSTNDGNVFIQNTSSKNSQNVSNGFGFNLTGNHLVVENNTGSGNFGITGGNGTSDGFYVSGDFAKIVGNVADGNSLNGFEVHGNTAAVASNRASDNGYPVWHGTGTGFQIYGNVNTVASNSALDNGNIGIDAEGTSVKVLKNRVTNNYNQGIYLIGSTMTVASNTVTFNDYPGIELESGSTAVVKANVSLQNQFSSDLQDDNNICPLPAGDTWVANIFGSANESCIH
jgi:parallel beta-helix repeat protein